MRLFTLPLFLLFSFSVLAQDEGCSDPQACNYGDESENCYYCGCDYGIEVEVVAVHTEGELAGMTTYRYYVTTFDPEEALTAVYGDEDSPLLVQSSTSFYQHMFGSSLGSAMYPEIYHAFPELEYDSWITIGLDEVPGEGEAGPTPFVSPDFDWVSQFESGGDIEMDDSIGGSWFIVDPNNASNAISGDDNRILVMQLTTDGEITGQINVQILEGGYDEGNWEGQNVTLSLTQDNVNPECGCTDETACNFDPEALYSDWGACEYIPEGDCDCDGNTYDIIGVCGGDCESDENLNGICDDEEIAGCLDETACTYDPEATIQQGIVSDEGGVRIELDWYPEEDIYIYVFTYNDSLELSDGFYFNLSGPIDLNVMSGYFYLEAFLLEQVLPNTLYITDQYSGIIHEYSFQEYFFVDIIVSPNTGCDYTSCFGCTIPFACNYDPEATVEDNSCIFICPGCTDDLACNYDPYYLQDDGSCIYPGCNDVAACNYVDDSGCDDGTCEYPDQFYDCDGSCLSDEDADGVCDEFEIPGCMNPDAGNYDETATDEDYCMFFGCTDGSACNYDPNANESDESCLFFDECGVCGGGGLLGCIDPAACNFSPNSSCDDGSCVYPGCIDDDACNFNENAACDDGSCEYDTCAGCTYIYACNYDPTATIDDNSSCEFGTCPGCTNFFACNFNPTVSEDDGSCEYCSCSDECGCTDELACNYNSSYTIEDGSCVYPDELYNCEGFCIEDIDEDGVCDQIDDCVGWFDECEICNGPGAIYECGCTYVPEGDCDCDGNQLDALGICGGDCESDINENGICDLDEIYGCTYEMACNYYPDATEEDGSCVFAATNYDCDGNCLNDSDGDGVCDEFEVIGCTDELSCTFNDVATDDDGTCLYLDECGICGGLGAIYDCGCVDLPEGYCDCNGNQLDALGICGGDCEADINENGICDSDELEGCTDDLACNYNFNALIDDGSCEYIEEGSCDCDGNTLDVIGVCGGMCEADIDADGICDDVDACVGEYDECGICNGPGAIYECGCGDIPEGDCDCDGNQLDAIGVCGGDCEFDFNDNDICDDQEIHGCTYSDASNYDATATDDDGSCVFDGVNNPCPSDLNGNGNVGSEDLLLFLSDYDTSCE